MNNQLLVVDQLHKEIQPGDDLCWSDRHRIHVGRFIGYTPGRNLKVLEYHSFKDDGHGYVLRPVPRAVIVRTNNLINITAFVITPKGE